MPSRIWIPVQLAAVSFLIAACGTSEEEPAETTTAAQVPERPTCEEFCAQLGGFGAGPAEDEPPVEIPPQEIEVSDDGVAGIEATCNLDVECAGAVLLTGLELEYGRADLRIPAGSTATVGVAVTDEGLRHLAENGDDPEVAASVGLQDEQASASFSPPLTLLAPSEPE